MAGTCYANYGTKSFPDVRLVSSHFTPCTTPHDSAQDASCCVQGDVCLDNGLCRSSDTDDNGKSSPRYYQAAWTGSTTKTWIDGDVQSHCRQITPDPVHMTYDPSTSQWHCQLSDTKAYTSVLSSHPSLDTHSNPSASHVRSPPKTQTHLVPRVDSSDINTTSSLSTGDWVGVAIGVVAGIVLLGVGVWFFWRRSSRAADGKKQTGYPLVNKPSKSSSLSVSLERGQTGQGVSSSPSNNGLAWPGWEGPSESQSRGRSPADGNAGGPANNDVTPWSNPTNGSLAAGAVHSATVSAGPIALLPRGFEEYSRSQGNSPEPASRGSPSPDLRPTEGSGEGESGSKAQQSTTHATANEDKLKNWARWKRGEGSQRYEGVN